VTPPAPRAHVASGTVAAWGAVRAGSMCAVSGALYVAAFPGAGIWPLGLVALVPLLLALRNQKPRTALLLGWICGTVTAFLGFFWLLGMLARYSGFPYPLCLLFLFLLSAYQGGRFALFAWLQARAVRNHWPCELAAIGAFAASETAFPLLFPWYFGAVAYRVPLLTQVADLGGPVLVSTVLLIPNLLVVSLIDTATRRCAPNLKLMVAAMGALLAAIGYGAVRIHQVDKAVAGAAAVRIGLVQGNVPMDIRGRQQYSEAYLRQVQLSRELIDRGAQIVIWPESAFLYTVPASGAEGFMRESLTRQLGEVPALVGAVVADDSAGANTRLFNSALMIDPSGRITGRYDKHHLLAFGEYLPMGDALPALYKLSPASGHFTSGTSLAPVQMGDHKMTVLICYEDILPAYVNRAVGQAHPELLVDITNDAWFGESVEPVMHLALATFRAVEHRRFLVRAANTGVSAVIDPVGRVVARTGTFKPAALDGEARWLQGGSGYEIWGDSPWWAVTVAAVAAAFLPRRPGRKRLKEAAD
jgi:apolipoprotein N-acyltransferase